ncbi:MAG: preprotein translocase subunit SecE [Spirochaetales bacterium]|nr:preprotein translocase subunit SecE [Spirochaetales bacterium]
MNKLIKFIRESYAELRKVIWPTKDEVASSTKVVIVSVFIIALILGFVDIILFRVLNLVF